MYIEPTSSCWTRAAGRRGSAIPIDEQAGCGHWRRWYHFRDQDDHSLFLLRDVSPKQTDGFFANWTYQVSDPERAGSSTWITRGGCTRAGRAVRARSFSIPDRSERCGAGERGVCCFFKTRLGRKWRVLYSYRPRGRDRRCCARSAARSRARREHDCPGQAHPIPGPVTSLRAGPTEPSTAATTGSGTRGDDP